MSLFDSVVVTGGGGMLAHALLGQLALRGVCAVALDKGACDIIDLGQLARLFGEHRPTVLFNCAAHTKVDLCEDQADRANAINGQAVGELAELCRRHGTFLVHFSTDAVFDGSLRRPYTPQDATGPLSAYGRSKLLGETLLQQAAPQHWLIVRTAWLFGPHGACFPRMILDRARAGQSLRVVNDQTGSPTYTADLATAVLDLLDHDAEGIWHVVNSGSVTWYDLARATLDEFAVDADLQPVSTAQWLAIRPKQAPRTVYSVLDATPFTRLAGRALPPWRDALHRYRAAC